MTVNNKYGSRAAHIYIRGPTDRRMKALVIIRIEQEVKKLTSVPPKSAMETGVSVQPSGTSKA